MAVDLTELLVGEEGLQMEVTPKFDYYNLAAATAIVVLIVVLGAISVVLVQKKL